jgi:hypothetical protein
LILQGKNSKKIAGVQILTQEKSLIPDNVFFFFVNIFTMLKKTFGKIWEKFAKLLKPQN